MAAREPNWTMGESDVIISSGVDSSAEVLWILGESHIVHELAGGTNYDVDLFDSVGIADAIKTEITFNRTFSEPVGVTDDLTPEVEYQKSLDESVGISDSLDLEATYNKTISESVGITDLFSRAVTYSKTILNNIGITDAILKAVSYAKGFSEAIGITDLLSTSFVLLVNLFDNIGITDAWSRAISYVRRFLESIGIVDSISETITTEESEYPQLGGLRVQIERDLYQSLEKEWKIPVELTSPDGQKQIYSVNNPDERLGGQILYFTRRENPITGEVVVVNQPVVVLRKSSLIRVPEAGEKWFIKMPIEPRANARWENFVFTPTRAPEHGTDIGFIRIYPQRIESDGVTPS